jgi:hypothetical protein
VHIAQQNFYAGWLSRVSLLLAFLAAARLTNWRCLSTPAALFFGVLAALSGILLGAFVTVALLSLAAIITLLRGRTRYANWALLAWLGFFTLLTPYYHPYARLLLPLCLAIFLASGVFIQDFLSRAAPDKFTQLAPRWQVGLAGAVIALILVSGYLLLPTGSRPWQTFLSMPQAAEALAGQIPPGMPTVVIGEPELAYYLNHRNVSAQPLVGNPDAIGELSGPAYIVAGRYARVAPAIKSNLAALGERLVRVERISIRPRDLRLLDDLSTAEARAYRLDPDNTFDLVVYRLNP